MFIGFTRYRVIGYSTIYPNTRYRVIGSDIILCPGTRQHVFMRYRVIGSSTTYSVMRYQVIGSSIILCPDTRNNVFTRYRMIRYPAISEHAMSSCNYVRAHDIGLSALLLNTSGIHSGIHKLHSIFGLAINMLIKD